MEYLFRDSASLCSPPDEGQDPKHSCLPLLFLHISVLLKGSENYGPEKGPKRWGIYLEIALHFLVFLTQVWVLVVVKN
uniref:Uncharacterized protein n=1 Tax=Pseudoalteromonas citrea DSM 8771 TaxID=1117314 RepID=U1JSA7_9GAMM